MNQWITDSTPGWTRFITKYVMPLVIIGFGYGYWFVGKLLNSTLSEFSNINTSITKVEFHERSNNKPIETIYTDVYLTTVVGIELHKKNLSKYALDQLSNNLTTNDLVEIFYDQRTNVIKELRLNSEPIILFQSELETHRTGRIIIVIFFFCFLFWYLSRMYRYRKYGRI